MSNVFNYKELVAVEFAHDYYENSKSNDFLVWPAPLCSQILKGTGLLFKTTGNGFKLYADVRKSANSFVLKKQLANNLKFTFLVKLTNPFFLNFTELPVLAQPNGVYYFNNLTKNISLQNQLYIVKKDDVVNGTDEKYASPEDYLRLECGNFNWHLTSTAPRVTAELRFADSGISIVQNLENNKDTFHFQFGLTSLPAERFDLYIDGLKVNNQPFYNNSSFWDESVFAVIELFYSDMVPDEYLFIDESQMVPDRIQIIRPKKYLVPFRRRKTKWRYIINKISNVTLPNPTIIESEDKWHFTPKGSMVFESDELIPMQESPISGIYLQRDAGDSSSIMHTSLPNAPVEMIRPDILQNQIYSDIYVNI
jgi:hypothetical protein